MKKQIFNIILIIFSLTFFELIFAIFFIFRPNPSISFLFKPFLNYDEIKLNQRIEYYDYVTEKYKPGIYSCGKIKYKINSYGFRGPEFNPEKKKDCLGLFGVA